MAEAAGTSDRTIRHAKAAVKAGQGEAVRDGKISAKAAAEAAKPKPSVLEPSVLEPSVLEPDDDIVEPEQEPFDHEQLKADVALVYAESDDRTRQLIDENNRLRAANKTLKSQLDEYMGKFNHTVGELKRWKRQCEKYERAEKERF